MTTAGVAGYAFAHERLRLKVQFRAITQGMLNAWHAALRQAPPAAEISVSEWHCHVVRAALTAGWVREPGEWAADQVENWDPVKVRWLALRVLDVHKELTTIPPD